MTKSGEIGLAVGRSIRAAQIPASDAAAVQLAKRYARLIDDAAALAAAADDLWDPETGLALGDEDGRKRLQALSLKLEAQAVASDLGPKLLQALSALGLTLAGRPASRGGGGVGRPTGRGSALQKLRDAAAGQHHAPAVD